MASLPGATGLHIKVVADPRVLFAVSPGYRGMHIKVVAARGVFDMAVVFDPRR